jgi:hypothetical protein
MGRLHRIFTVPPECLPGPAIDLPQPGSTLVLVRTSLLPAVLLGLLAGHGALRASRALLELDSEPLLAGEARAEVALARGAASWAPSSATDFSTGAELYDREWAFGAPAMRAACLAQVILRHPEADEALGPELDRAVTELMATEGRAFSAGKWGSDPLASDRVDHDHAAYLGYAGFAVGLASWAHPRWAVERERIADRLRSRVDAAGDAWPETYPGESYPVDVAAGVAALALDEPADAPSTARARSLDLVRSAVDPASGLLQQAVDPGSGIAVDRPRGSGTFLAAYFLPVADASLAGALYRRGRDTLSATRLGFLGMRELAEGTSGQGDVDSGPILLDLGVSSSGFALAGARAFGDHATFRGLDATARLFGAPVDREGGGVVHVAGGPLGDAILCATRTAPTPDELAAWRPRAPLAGGGS